MLQGCIALGYELLDTLELRFLEPPEPRLQYDKIQNASDGPAMLAGYERRSFDPWCLTDARKRSKTRDRRQEIRRYWANDPNPYKTLAILEKLTGAIRYRYATRSSQQRDYGCPWPTVYQVLKPFTAVGVQLKPDDDFVFWANDSDGVFKREIYVV